MILNQFLTLPTATSIFLLPVHRHHAKLWTAGSTNGSEQPRRLTRPWIMRRLSAASSVRKAQYHANHLEGPPDLMKTPASPVYRKARRDVHVLRYFELKCTHNRTEQRCRSLLHCPVYTCLIICIDLLSTKLYLSNLKTQFAPRSKHSASVIKADRLVPYREIIAVCSEIHTKHINALWAEHTISEC